MPCNCNEQTFDAYLDGQLSEGEAKAAATRVAECSQCQAKQASWLTLKASLASLPVEEPRPEFFDQAMAVAMRRRRSSDRKRRSQWSVAPGAVAAVLLVWLAVGLIRGESAPSARAAEVTIALSTTSPINLVFEATDDLVDARVSLALPNGLEVDGFEGRREISWTTDLHRGKNVLRVPLLARAEPTDELVARLDHGTGSKTFRLKVRVI